MPLPRPRRTAALRAALLCALIAAGACGDVPEAERPDDGAEATAVPVDPPPSPATPTPLFRNVGTGTAYVGDAACEACHAEAAAAYRRHAMASSFHRWTEATRVEPILDTPIRHARSGLAYEVVEEDGRLWQVETITTPDGRRLHELRAPIDWVMGSGAIARTYFTEENGRLFQMPLTWYAEGGWDFSPGYEIDNARFSRLLPDRCLACHASYPDTLAYVEGKYERLVPGIGCERCHGPGALHVREREAGPPASEEGDDSIVDPARLPLDRRMDVCEQCHVHTPVTVLREGRDAFAFEPSESLAEHAAFFRAPGSIDLVSHADRLRQSACFRATQASSAPLECATCHDPHTPPDATGANVSCRGCHAPDSLARRLSASPSLGDHGEDADCVGCHMPRAEERTVPHGDFTDHWIRVPGAEAPASATPTDDSPVDPYFDRDRSGPEAGVYRGMGEVVFATLATNPGLLADAARDLAGALGEDSSRADAWFLLGVAYRQLGRDADAVGPLERALGTRPDDPQTLHALARTYESLGRAPAEIEALYERALELQPALAWIRAHYARFLRGASRVEEAEVELRTALEEEPGLAVAWFELGTLVAGQGRLGEATDAFQRAVRLDPNLAEALTPLLQVRARAGVASGVRALGSPIGSLPVRDRGPAAVRVAPDGPGRPGLRLGNVPPGAVVRIVDPDGALVRELPGEPAQIRVWDLADRRGMLVPGGLYRIELRDRSPATRAVYVGIVRADGG